MDKALEQMVRDKQEAGVASDTQERFPAPTLGVSALAKLLSLAKSGSPDREG